MRNQIYEQAITKQGIGYSYNPKLAIEEIDVAKGKNNQARLAEPLDPELVEDYVRAMRDGSEFPPVVVWRAGKGRWIPVDGNHGLAARIKRGYKFTDAYLLDTKDEQIADRLTWKFNNLVNGRRLSREECLQHAVTSVRKYGAEMLEAANEYGVPVWRVKTECGALELKDILGKANVRIPASVSNDKLNKLKPLLALGEDLFVEGAKTLFSAGAAVGDCIDLLAKVRAAKTMPAKKQAIVDFAKTEQYKSRMAESKGGTIKRKSPLPRHQLAKQLSAMHRLLEDYGKDALRPSAADYQVVWDVALEVTDSLISLFGLGALKKKGVG